MCIRDRDYPNLISGEERVDTIAVPAVLAAYNWAPNTERYRKLSLFVDAFFTKFPTFQNPPFHPKWKEVSLSAPLPGWQRLPAATQWLRSHAMEGSASSRFDDPMMQSSASGRAAPIGMMPRPQARSAPMRQPRDPMQQQMQ